MSVMGVTTTIESRPECFTLHDKSSGAGRTQRASADVTSSVRVLSPVPTCPASAVHTSDARTSALRQHNISMGCDQVFGRSQRSFYASGKGFRITHSVEVRTKSPILGEVTQQLHRAEQKCARLLAKLTCHDRGAILGAQGTLCRK
jgi:hypothetical protein